MLTTSFWISEIGVKNFSLTFFSSFCFRCKRSWRHWPQFLKEEQYMDWSLSLLENLINASDNFSSGWGYEIGSSSRKISKHVDVHAVLVLINGFGCRYWDVALQIFSINSKCRHTFLRKSRNSESSVEGLSSLNRSDQNCFIRMNFLRSIYENKQNSDVGFTIYHLFDLLLMWHNQ